MEALVDQIGQLWNDAISTIRGGITFLKAAAAFLQAINLSIVVIATQIGLELDVIDAGTSAALLAAGILSVLIYPPIALAFLGDESELEEVVEQEEL